jgi:hypothetical protein
MAGFCEMVEGCAYCCQMDADVLSCLLGNGGDGFVISISAEEMWEEIVSTLL